MKVIRINQNKVDNIQVINKEINFNTINPTEINHMDNMYLNLINNIF